MKAVTRLLSYGRRYWAHLLGSVFLMAVAGAAQAAMLLLVRQVFDRVLVDRPVARRRCCRTLFSGASCIWKTWFRCIATTCGSW